MFALPKLVEFNQEIADTICGRLAEGESLRAICLSDDMPGRTTVFKWLLNHPDFANQYARARELQADTLFEEILEIADDSTGDRKVVGEEGKEVCDTEFVQRSRLRVDARKWMAGKMAPKKYGEKVDVNHQGDMQIQIITGVPRANG